MRARHSTSPALAPVMPTVKGNLTVKQTVHCNEQT